MAGSSFLLLLPTPMVTLYEYRIILENKTYQNCPKEKAVHLSAHCHQNSGNVKRLNEKTVMCVWYFLG